MQNPLAYIKIIGAMMQKNFRTILRSRSSALVILLGPFLIIFLIGLAFNTTGLHNIKIGMYIEESNEIVEEMKQSLENNDFAVKETETEEACIDAVKAGSVHLCMSVGGNLSQESIDREITFHVDYSKVNLVFTILNVITHEVEDISTDLSLEYATLLIEQMNSTAVEIHEKSALILELSNSAEEMKQSLEQLSTELGALEVNSSAFGISTIESQIASSSAQIEEFGSIAEETTASGMDILDDLESFITAFESELENQITTVEGFEETVSSYTSLACTFDFSDVEGLTFNPCIELQTVEDALDDAISQAESLGVQFDTITAQLDAVRDDLETALEDQQDILDSAEKNIASLSSQLKTSSTKIDQLGGQRDAIVGDLDTLVTTLDENIATIDAMQQSIEEISDNLARAEITKPEHLVNPIMTRIKPVLESKSYLDYTMPALLVLVVMFMSILLSSTIVITEKSSRAYFRNYITPVPDTFFLMSIYATSLSIVFVQSVVLLVIAQLAFGVAIFSNIVSIILALLLIASLFILIGMSLGYIFVSEETATLASISLASILLLFSSFLIPIESLSEPIGTIAAYSPFVLSESVLRQLLIFGNPITAAMNDFLLLLFYVLVGSVLLYLSEMVDKRRLR